MPDVLPPICVDCEDHGDGSYTCDSDRPACRYRVRPHDDLNPAPSPAAEPCGRSFRSGSGRYYDCERAAGHDGRHSAFPDAPSSAAAPPHDLRAHTADCYERGCTTGTHSVPRPGQRPTGGPYTPAEVVAGVPHAATARRLAWFTNDELRAELTRRAALSTESVQS